LLGEEKVKYKKYDISISKQKLKSQPVRKDEVIGSSSGSYDTIAQLEALYFYNALSTWSPIINDFESSLLAILGNNEDVNNIWNKEREDFLTVIEKDSREQYGKTQSEYKKYGKKLKEKKEYLEQKEEVPEELRNYLEYHHNYKTHTIIHTDIHTEHYELDKNEIIVECNIDFENYVNEYNREGKREIVKLLEQWSGKQPKQAELARKTVDYIVRNLNKDMDEDEIKTIFRVTTIAESLGTEHKEIRSIFNKLKEDTPSLKDLLV